jgi:hypothetical protein
MTEAQKAVAEGRSCVAEHLAPPISSSEVAGELVHGIDANEE